MRTPEPRFSGRLLPNGEFGVSRLKEISLRPAARQHDKNAFNQMTLRLIAALGFYGAIARLDAEKEAERLRFINLSNVTKSHRDQIRARRGTSGLTRRGGQILRNAGYLLEKSVPKELCTFLTVTLPPLPQSALEILGDRWSEITRVFQQRIHRHLVAAGLPGEIFGCTEIQEERYKDTGDVYLHLHWCFQGRLRYQSWSVRVEEVKEWWTEILERELGMQLPQSPRIEMVPVRKSVAGYMAKYVSKGSALIGQIVNAGLQRFLPSSWYMCSQSIRERIKLQTVQSYLMCDWLVLQCESADQSSFIWKKRIMLTFPDGGRCGIGYAGKLTEEAAQIAREVHAFSRGLDTCATVAS